MSRTLVVTDRQAELQAAIAKHGGIAAAMRVTGADYEEVQEAWHTMQAAVADALPPGRPARCGTLAAYRRHVRNNDTIDRACLRAWLGELHGLGLGSPALLIGHAG